MVVSRANGVSGSKTNAQGEGEGKNDSCNTMKAGKRRRSVANSLHGAKYIGVGGKVAAKGNGRAESQMEIRRRPLRK